MKSHLRQLLAAISVASLAACGGGGSPTAELSPPSLSGTVAVGAPLPGASVTLKDATGKTLTVTAGADGSYTFKDVSGLTAPLMLQAKGTAGGASYTLHSVLESVPAAGVSGVINVTPATDAATAQAVGADPATVFADATKIKAVDAVKLADAKARLNAALKDVLTALGEDPSKVDLFTTKFAADNKGLDKLLDLVAVSSNASTSGQEIKITDKNTQASNTIAPDAKPADVAKVGAPSDADVKLDTSGIKNFLSAFNALTATADNINSAAMLDLFDAEFLDNGNNRAAQIASIAKNAVGMQLSNYVLNGCNTAATPVVCQGQATATKSDKSTETFPLPVVLGTDKKWRAYGNRAPFKFELKPLAYQQNYVGTNPPAPTLQTGVNFYFTGYAGSSYDSSKPRTYQSVILYGSTDDGANWTETTRLKVNSTCNGDYLPIDVGTSTSTPCTNFKVVSNATAIANNNAAQAQGKKWFKIVAYPNADYTGTPTSYQHRSARPLFDTTTGAAAVAASGLSITSSELGTNSVSFFGNLLDVNIGIQPVGLTYEANWAAWQDKSMINALGGKATIAAALAQCGSSCTTAYGAGAKITSIQLSNNDAQGRGVWVRWLTVTSTTATTSTTNSSGSSTSQTCIANC